MRWTGVSRLCYRTWLGDDGIDVATNDMRLRNGMGKGVEEVNQKGRRAIEIPGDVSHELDVVAVVERTAKVVEAD